jgi:hypothetical protein
MKRIDIRHSIIKIAFGVCALALISCGGHNTIVRMPEVQAVPDGKFERIIKLYNPEGSQEKTLAGIVFIKKGASVCTNYPREELIKSLNELSAMDRNAYRYFSNYEIKEDDKSYGFVSIPLEYNVILWKDEKNENCIYKVQVDWINKDRDSLGEMMPGRGPGGGHGH